MSLIDLIYVPTGSPWRRFTAAIFTCYVNLHLRWAERRDQEFYGQLDRAEIE